MAHPVDPAMDDALDRMRYVAAIQRRSTPPRCHPISICITIQGIGLVFIGATMTLIANWPGATSVGSNPLRIAGPVILGFGGLVCVVGLVLTRLLRKKEAKKFDEKITHMAKTASRQFLEQTGAASTETKPKVNIEFPSDKNFQQIEERKYLLSPELSTSFDETQRRILPAAAAAAAAAEEEEDVPQAIRKVKQRRKELAASSEEDLTEDESTSEAERRARRERRKERKRQKELQQQQQQQLEAQTKAEAPKPEIPAKTKPPPVKPKPKVELPSDRESPKPGSESPTVRMRVRPAPGTTVIVHSGRATPPNLPAARPAHKSVESDI